MVTGIVRFGAVPTALTAGILLITEMLLHRWTGLLLKARPDQYLFFLCHLTCRSGVGTSEPISINAFSSG